MATVAVLGAGSWGTALALQLARNRHTVKLWAHDAGHIARLKQDGCNQKYLPGITFPPNLMPEADLAAAQARSDQLLLVVPSHAFTRTLALVLPDLSANTGFAWATKGLEHGTGRFLHQAATAAFAAAGRHPSLAVVSGPSFAREVAQGLPTAITVASDDGSYALSLAGLLHGSGMLAYTSTDIVGVELGGAVKNVLAIAAGIADGLGFGANTRSALITRGLAEMVRLGETLGGSRETFMGLTGVGDLVLTCTDDQSRNRRFGLAIGKGRSLAAAQAEIGQVVEGAAAVLEIMRLARQRAVDMPICEHVEKVLYRGMTPRQAVQSLLARAPRAETD